VFVNYWVYCVQVNTTSVSDSQFYLTTSNGVIGGQRAQEFGTPYIHDDNPSSSGGLWSKEISVATPCRLQPGLPTTAVIYLYDLDIGRKWGVATQGRIPVTLIEESLSGGSSSPVGFEVFTNYNLGDPSNPANFSGNALDGISQIFATGEHQNFFLRLTGTIKPGTKYTLKLDNINDLNSIKIGLPADQINTSFACPQAPTCTFNNMPSIMSTGATADIDVTVTNTNDPPLTFNPADTSSSLTLINPGNAHARAGQYFAPGTSINANATPDNTTRWRNLSPADATTVMSNFTDPLDGRVKERIHPSSVRTIAKGQSITFRVRIRAADLVSGNLPASAVGYDIGFRVLQRQYRPMWDAFLPYSPSCAARIPVQTTPPVISADCTATGSGLEPGGVYSPFINFTHSTPTGADATGRVVLTIRDQNNVVLPGSGRQNLNFTIAHPISPPPRVTSVGVTGATYVFAAPNTTISFPTAGVYTATYDWSWVAGAQSGPPAPVLPATTNDCVVTITVATRPYFKVLGDIITINTSAVVNGWNQGLGAGALGYEASFPIDIGGSFGAGAQGMILSAGSTSGVASRFRNTGGNVRSLTLANTTPPGDAIWGGSFGSPYLMPIPALVNVTGLPTINAISAFGAASQYNLAGNVLAGGSIPAGRRVTIYVNGDVRITPGGGVNGITYANVGSYANRAAMPRFRLIATGNIYVDPAVTQLDGEYIAGNGGTGSIYTCFASGWTAPLDGTSENPYNVPGCRSTLLVNGALLGDSIKLTRVVGTLRSAAAIDGNMTGINTYQNSTNISEIIQFTPELFLVNPAGTPDDPAGDGYDSITALPPLF